MMFNIRKLFNWIFKTELDKLNSEVLKAKNIGDKLEEQRGKRISEIIKLECPTIKQ